jgi:hypothetical protein
MPKKHMFIIHKKEAIITVDKPWFMYEIIHAYNPGAG